MVQWVYERASSAKSIDEVVVATDDDRIMNHVLEFGGKSIMTSSAHESGTDRCNEVVNILTEKGLNFDAVINIQGDEPSIDPKQIDQVAELLMQGKEIATLAKKISDDEEINNPNVVKVAWNTALQNSLYFSRSAIPFHRNNDEAKSFYKHIGIYGYQVKTLSDVSKLPPSNLEKLEKLEQLRWLENGYKIAVTETFTENIGIDQPEDLKKLPKLL